MLKRVAGAVLVFLVLVFAGPTSADERWDEYISNAQSVGNTSTEFSFGFKASEVLVLNSGAQSCYIRYKSGNATTADKRIPSGGQAEFRYSSTDIGGGAGVPSIRIICPSTSTVDVWAVRPY